MNKIINNMNNFINKIKANKHKVESVNATDIRISHIQYIAFKTIVSKECIRMFRVWSQTFLPSVITTSLYFLIFGKFIGAQVANIGDHTYMQYIVPGLVMMAVITNSYMNVVSSFYVSKFMKNIEEILVAPVSYSTIISGFVMGGVIRGMFIGVFTLAVSLFFTHMTIVHLWAVIYFIFMTSMMFSLAGLINGIYAKSFDHTTLVITFILTPLTYLGGVFYSVNMLGTIWQEISMINPILYMVNGFRYGFLGVADVDIWTCLTVVTFLTFIFFGWTIHLFKTGRAIRM